MIKNCKYQIQAFCMKYDQNIEDAERFNNITCIHKCPNATPIYTGQDRLLLMRKLYNEIIISDTKILKSSYISNRDKSPDINAPEQILSEMEAIKLLYHRKWRRFSPEEFCYYIRLMRILRFHIPRAALRRYRRLSKVDFVGMHLSHARRL